MDNRLTSNEPLTQLLHPKKVFTWNEAVHYVRHIPYGRNTSRTEFSLVLTENKGTCSSKHAFLKELAVQNQIPDVQLIVGIYKMTEDNTNIGNILSDNNIKYIPEAHCYLKIDGKTVDVTSKDSNFDKIKLAILEEIEIEPFQVADFKVNYHQNFIKRWLKETDSEFTFDEIWKIREQCIKKLSQFDNDEII